MDTVALSLGLSAVLFSIDVFGVLIRRNIIVILMCIELMLNAANIAFVALAKHFGTIDGQICVFFVMCIAAAEAAVGLAVVISAFRSYVSVCVEDAALLKN